MNKIRIAGTVNWKELGIVAYYGYFAVNMLMKAFTYDHGDQIYKCFFAFGMSFLAVKLMTTKYTLREVIWVAILAGVGLGLSVITKQNTWLLLFATIAGMKNCRFETLAKIALAIRTVSLSLLVAGSYFGVYDIGFKTTPDTKYVEIPVYSFAMNEPNTAFLAVFLTLGLLLYCNYDRLNRWWFLGTSAVALLFYQFTYCRTGVAVFFFCWALIILEKLVKSRKIKFLLVLSVPAGALFSFVTMVLYDAGNPFMKLMSHLVSGRIYIMNGYYKELGISLIPRTQELFYANYYGLIDNTYMFVLLYCGVFVALFFFVTVCVTLYRLWKRGNYKELVMITGMALYGVLEQYVMNGFMNVFILLCGILLYPNLLEEGDKNGKEDENSGGIYLP